MYRKRSHECNNTKNKGETLKKHMSSQYSAYGRVLNRRVILMIIWNAIHDIS